MKTKLNDMEVLISKALIDLYINHDESFSVDNEDVMKWRNLENVVEDTIQIVVCKFIMLYQIILLHIKQWKRIVSIVRKLLQLKILSSIELNKID